MVVHIFPSLVLYFFFPPCEKTSLLCIWLSWLKINCKEKNSLQTHCAFSLYCWLPKSFVYPLLPMKGSWEYFLYLFHQILLTTLLERIWSSFILLGWSIRQQHRTSPFHVDIRQYYVLMLVWKHLLCSSLHLQVLLLCISETENCLGEKEDRKKWRL